MLQVNHESTPLDIFQKAVRLLEKMQILERRSTFAKIPPEAV